MEGAFIIGNGQVTPIHGGLHQYKAHDGAKFGLLYESGFGPAMEN